MDGVADPWPGRLSLGWPTLAGATQLEVIAAAAAAGFSDVGLKFVRRPGDTEPALCETPWLFRDIATALQDTGVAVLTMAGIWLDGRPPLDWCTGALEAAAALGVEFVVVVALDPERRRVVDHFSALCGACAKLGMRVLLEFAPWSAARTIEEAHRIVLASRHGNAGVLVDALHLYRSGGSAEALRRMPGADIGLAQIADAPARPLSPSGLSYEGRHDRLDVGAGCLPLVDFVRSLPREVPIEVEVPCRHLMHVTHPERAALAAAAARRLLQSAASLPIEVSP